MTKVRLVCTLSMLFFSSHGISSTIETLDCSWLIPKGFTFNQNEQSWLDNNRLGTSIYSLDLKGDFNIRDFMLADWDFFRFRVKKFVEREFELYILQKESISTEQFIGDSWFVVRSQHLDNTLIGSNLEYDEISSIVSYCLPVASRVLNC